MTKWLVAAVMILVAGTLATIVNHFLFEGNPITSFLIGFLFGIFAGMIWLGVYSDEL